MNSTLRAKLMARLMKNAKGFTLIELLVVIVIVGVLSAVAVPTFLNQVRRSRVAEAQAGLDVVTTAAEIYRFDSGTYPTYAAIDPAGAAGTRYLDAIWTQSAPNYGDPTNANGAPDVDGVVFTTTATNVPTYTTNGTVALECDMANGNQNPRATNDAETGCNL